MKTDEIVKLIENFCPSRLAYEWDNVGLLCGDGEKDIQTVFVTLDTNVKTVQEAIDAGADMIISHHPILFSPINRIDYTTPTGKMLYLLIKHDIPLLAAHTNMDTARGGINDRLAKIFKLTDVKILEQHTDDETAGLGRIGALPGPVMFYEFAKLCGEYLNTTVRASGDFNKLIKTIAVASGSCSEVIPAAIAKGADAIVTGDMKYHNTLDMTENGICIVDAGHYPTEICVMDIFEDILKHTNLKIIKSKHMDIFKFI